MAQRKEATAHRRTARKKVRRKTSAVARLEEDLPRLLKEFSRDARRNLTRLDASAGNIA